MQGSAEAGCVQHRCTHVWRAHTPVLHAPLRPDPVAATGCSNWGAAGEPASGSPLLVGECGLRRPDRPSSSTVTAAGEGGRGMPCVCTIRHWGRMQAVQGQRAEHGEGGQQARPRRRPPCTSQRRHLAEQHSRWAPPNDLRLLMRVAAMTSWKPQEMLRQESGVVGVACCGASVSATLSSPSFRLPLHPPLPLSLPTLTMPARKSPRMHA